MKAIKIILIAVLLLVVLYTAICALMPKDYKIERSTIINAPLTMVFEEVNDFNNMQHWSPWKDYDPEMQIKIDGKPEAPGYKYSWSSKNDKVGHGSLTRKHTEPNKIISNDLLFEDFNMHSNVDWTFDSSADGVKITWTNSGSLPFMMRIMEGKLESMMAPDLEKGLKRLKLYCEAQPPIVIAPAIKIEITTVQQMNYLAVRDTANATTISQKLGMLYGMVGVAMAKQKLKQAGAPFAIYYSESPTLFDMDAGVSVDKPGRDDGKVKAGSMKSGNAVVAHYFGSYMQLGKAHDAIHQWLIANNKRATGAPWEMYITDPGIEKDTAKWQTDVYYPIE